MKYEEFSSATALNATGNSPHLTDREKHVVGLAVTAPRGCIKCTGSRIKKAIEAGIPYDSIVAAIDLAAAVNTGVTLAIAIQGAELTGVKAPTPAAICEDGSCTIGVS